jgi:hypothetical protein
MSFSVVGAGGEDTSGLGLETAEGQLKTALLDLALDAADEQHDKVARLATVQAEVITELMATKSALLEQQMNTGAGTRGTVAVGTRYCFPELACIGEHCIPQSNFLATNFSFNHT